MHLFDLNALYPKENNLAIQILHLVCGTTVNITNCLGCLIKLYLVFLQGSFFMLLHTW